MTFEGCCSLPIENNVRYADKWAVGVDDKSLSQYTLRDDTKGLVNTFSGCGNMTSIIFPDGITIIGDGAFYGCTSLTSITIPDGITIIGDGAFSGCNSMTSIAFPNSLITIGFNAFNGCDSLTSIIIPESVTSIDEFAFFDCSALKSVKVIAETPPVAYDYTFSNYEIELCVPEKSISAYQTTNPWSKFKTLKNLTGETSISDVKASPVVIQASNGTITVSGADDGTMVEVYGISGAKLGEAKTSLNTVTIHTNMQRGNVVIVKVGNKAMKVAL